MKSKTLKIWGILGIVSLTCAWSLTAMGAEYPSKPVTLILPHPPGGAADMTARPLANAARKVLGQPIIVENMGGGGGTVGPQIVASKPPDGYTLGVMFRSSVVAWHMGKLNFNPVEVTHIMNYSGLLMGIAVRSESQWKTLQEFVEYAKKNPGAVTYGSPGVGTTAHLPMEEFAQDAGLQFVHIPYKGDAGTVPALLGGHVNAISATSAAWAPLVRAGKVRLLGIYWEKRSAAFPQVPTLTEAGYKVVEPCPIGVFGPKGLPKPIVQKVHAAFKKAMDDPDFQKVLKSLDMPALYLDPADSEKLILKDNERYRKLVEKLGLKG